MSEGEAPATTQPLRRRWRAQLPKTMTMAKVKVLCEKLLGVKVAAQAPSVQRAGVERAEPVSDDRTDLYLLGLGSGDTICVD